MVFWHLFKTDCKEVNWQSKFRLKDQIYASPTNSSSFKKVLVERTWNLIFAGLVLTYSLKPRTSGVFQIHIEVPHILKELEVKTVKLLGGDCV